MMRENAKHTAQCLRWRRTCSSNRSITGRRCTVGLRAAGKRNFLSCLRRRWNCRSWAAPSVWRRFTREQGSYKGKRLRLDILPVVLVPIHKAPAEAIERPILNGLAGAGHEVQVEVQVV